MAKFNARGHEVLNSKPAAIPLGFKKPLPVTEMVRRMVQREISRKASARGLESFEEADDFTVGDEPELRSPYELDEDQENAKFLPEEPINDRDKRIAGAAQNTDDAKNQTSGRRKTDKLEDNGNRKSAANKSANAGKGSSAAAQKEDDEE